MKIYVGIDDTDSIDQGATGQTANRLIRIIEDKCWGSCQGLTRHQLLLHPDIPYTSHNSSMCFTCDMESRYLERFIKEAGGFLKRDSAPGSDPGLCVAVEKEIQHTESLIKFGYETKRRVVRKEESYALADRLGIHLSEHGGIGIGVIGALAAVGLRMTDNDGRFQGKLELKTPGEIVKVDKILSSSLFERVQDLDGRLLDSNEKVRLGNKLKAVLLKGKRTLLVYKPDGAGEWATCTNAQLESY